MKINKYPKRGKKKSIPACFKSLLTAKFLRY